MRYLGIDYGTGKVGIALSDEAGSMGFPHDTFINDARLSEKVRELAAKEGVGAIVIGESHDFKGNANPVAEAAHAFGTMLSEESGLPVFYESEVLTTEEARRAPDGTRGKGAVDASAAALILTSYLSRSHE